MVADLPVWVKLGSVALVANEVRGVIMAAPLAADLAQHGGRLQPIHFVYVLILVVPLVAWRLWKAHKRRQRIQRRLDWR